MANAPGAEKKRILSGMRPTGRLHLGNLVGALANWRGLQDEYQCYFMVADYHALMSEYAKPQGLFDNTREVVIDWVSCGLDPERSVIFRQSDVPGHAELHLVLGCYTPLGWLERCPTYKEQLQQISERDLTNYAFLGYPCLQAADIMLYKANVVPVGEDQLPHLELTREIVRRFNNLVGREVFPEPMAKLTQAARLLGLDRRKMSKSYGNQIDIADDEETVNRKVMSMITDPLRVRFKDPGHPEDCNVCQWYKVFRESEYETIAEKCRNADWGCTDCKKNLGGIINEMLSEPRAKRRQLEGHPGLVEDILARGAERAGAAARRTMDEVFSLTGLGRKA
jgi:tryptophanyl-tRNA synthetase